MKKRLLLLLILFNYDCEKEKEVPLPKIEIIKKEAEYASSVYLNDCYKITNGKVTSKNYLIDTNRLGEKSIIIKYVDDNNKEYKYHFTFMVKDTTKPLLLHHSSYTIKTGTKDLDLVSKMICGDNYDANLTCTVLGSYDVNTPGEYPLKFAATDSSGNYTESAFTLIVKDNVSYESYSRPKQNINDVIASYKVDNTEIGIDVSEWQGDIDWVAVKNAGVSFAMIRIGHGSNDDGTYYEDKKFVQNLKGAKEAGIKVGIYYYSKASNKEEAIRQAKWIVSVLNKEKLDLPIAFDWESWSSFNSFHVSYVGLNNIAKAFIKEVQKAGYQGMNYGSASYLDQIWNIPEYLTWLANYTDKTNYDKPYDLWQLSNTGVVPGINGDVDLDILYKNKK